jgi:septum formation inhibitor-activating ATPase MinD
VIHGLDITVPLGIDRRIPADTMSVVMANITTANNLVRDKTSGA